MVWPAFSARCEEAWIAGPVGHGVGERHAELDDVGAGLRQALSGCLSEVS